MLNDERSYSPSAEDLDEVAVTAHISDPARAGMVDVVSLRGLVRAVNALRRTPNENALNEALARMINVNGTIAKAIEGDGR